MNNNNTTGSNLNNQNNSNYTSNKNVNLFGMIDQRLKERAKREKEAYPMSIAIFLCIVTIFFSVGFVFITEESLVHVDYTYYIRSIVYAIIACPILYIVFWLILIKNITKLFLGEFELKVLHIAVIITILISSTCMSLVLVKTLNRKLNKNPRVTMYFRLAKKDIVTTENKKKHTQHHDYYFYFNSWFDDSLFSYEVSESEYCSRSIGDIFKATTHKGYFGYYYYTDLYFYKPLNQSLFPKDTKFPIPEDEGDKLIEEAKQEKLKQKKEEQK